VNQATISSQKNKAKCFTTSTDDDHNAFFSLSKATSSFFCILLRTQLRAVTFEYSASQHPKALICRLLRPAHAI